MAPKPLAVLMGDIVDSEGVMDRRALHARFNHAIEARNTRAQPAPASPLTITLGDEFQGLTHTLRQAAELARALRMDLLAGGIECRFVIGQVRLETEVNPDRAWNMMGEGLGRARDRLNEKRAGRAYRFSLLGDDVTEALLEALGASLSTFETGWTARQREVIAAHMDGAEADAIAAQDGVSRHSIYKVRAAGHYEPYRLGWSAVMTALDAQDAAA
ncbi:MAG: SatD family protein [Pseudomonadota bacterium]